MKDSIKGRDPVNTAVSGPVKGGIWMEVFLFEMHLVNPVQGGASDR